MIYKGEISDEIKRLSNIYTNDISNIPFLSKEHQESLFTAWKKNGNIDARNKLIISNLRLSHKIALIYYKKTFPLPELVNVGNSGLIEAVYKFNPKLKTKFSSFAYKHITGKILRYMKEFSNETHVPENITDDRNKEIKKIGKIFKEKGTNSYEYQSSEHKIEDSQNSNYRIENDIEDEENTEEKYQELYNSIRKLNDKDQYIIITHFQLKLKKPRIDIRYIGNNTKQRKRIKEILKILELKL